jgi:hypothetical protein
MAGVHIENNDLDILPNLKHLGRMGNLSSPRHLRNVDEPSMPLHSTKAP